MQGPALHSSNDYERRQSRGRGTGCSSAGSAAAVVGAGGGHDGRLRISSRVSVVHGDVKASTPPGSATYVDPHYLRSGALTKRSDVYSFGVLLLELVTGVQAFCDGRLLTAAVVTPQKMNTELVDHRLGCRYDPHEAGIMVALAAACVREDPSLRPSMADVVRTLENKIIKQRQKELNLSGAQWRRV